ncbi:MAG TPA: hypothetical protein VGQ96_01365, partial [Candidatus Eremiobacteraceae bacterium]|nr:hypothetical protein [Candidatus Eremiobacteraceae bacterium]
MLFLAITEYGTCPTLAEFAAQLCVVWFAQFPPVHAHAFGEPVAQVAVRVIGMLIVPEVGPEIVHPEGAFDTMQLSVWFGAVPESAKLSQLLSLRVIFAAWTGDAANASTIAALASAALVLRIRERIMGTPEGRRND